MLRAMTAEVRLAFAGECRPRGRAAGWAFVVEAGGSTVGHGWGALRCHGGAGSGLGPALLALEQGLAFLLETDLARRAIRAETDTSQAIEAVLGPTRPGRRPAIPEDLTHIVGQFDSLRFAAVELAKNRPAQALARLALDRFHRGNDRVFEAFDDRGLTEFMASAAGRAVRGARPGASPWPSIAPGAPDFFSLPFDPERLHAVFERLPLREREILKLRFGLAGQPPWELGPIGRAWRISKSRASQLVWKAQRRLEVLALRMDPWT
jgi:hypothetical protein